MYTLPNGRYAYEHESMFWKDSSGEYYPVDAQYVQYIMQQWEHDRHIEWLQMQEQEQNV
jgi:hypothetical protein